MSYDRRKNFARASELIASGRFHRPTSATRFEARSNIGRFQLRRFLSKFVRVILILLSYPAIALVLGCNSITINSVKTTTPAKPAIPPSLALTTSDSSSVFASPVTFTAKSSTTLIGSVDFYDSAALIGSGTLTGNVAQLTISTLSAGPHTIKASLDSTTGDGNVSSIPITQTVVKATPAVIWPSPAAIPYGAALSAIQLDASSTTVPGTFTYTPAAGTILTPGSHTLSLTFTPTDTNDFEVATATATLDVTIPSIVIRTPSSSILAGSTYQFSAFTTDVVGTATQSFVWAVNSQVAGNPQVGTISATGVFSAPANSNEVVTISAALAAVPSVQGTTQAKVVGPVVSPGKIEFGFSLPAEAATSAGVYDSSGSLLRTLWSNRQYPAGPQIESWDGNDDYGNPSAPGSYQIRVLSNNVTYDWGVIGDTSASWLGPNNWDFEGEVPTDMAISGTTAVVGNGYGEYRPNAAYFSLSDPQQPLPLLEINQCNELQYVATDGSLIYFADTGTGWPGSSTLVIAVDAQTHTQYRFPAGVTVSNCGNPLNGVIDIAPNGSNTPATGVPFVPSGIAVQTQGNLLAVAHGMADLPPGDVATSNNRNMIELFDKVSGRLLSTININNPRRIAFAPNGDLWVISGAKVVRISAVGNQNVVASALQGVSVPLSIAVDPTTSDVLVADGGEVQQVKRFSSAGNLISTFGDLGGYTDCSPKVTKTRLFLDSTAGPGYPPDSEYGSTAFLAVQPDSSFWIGDPGNARVLHISSQGQYIEEISFLRFLYNIAADHGNPSRIFADALEYSVDYTKTLEPGDPDPLVGGNGSWSLVNNWGACLPSAYSPNFLDVQTFGNGRTYATVPNSNPSNAAPGGPLWELVELPGSGPLRFSGHYLNPSAWNFEHIDHEGGIGLWNVGEIGDNQVQIAYHQDLIGYDANAWPVWGASKSIASVPANNAVFVQGFGWESTDPNGTFSWGMGFAPQATSGGLLATYNPNPSTPGVDHHLGGVKVGANDWSWKASPGALLKSPDDEGTFSDINSFGGHNGIAALVEGSSIIEGYDGQGGTYSSQWMQWSEDGLLIGQFGHPMDFSGEEPNNVPLFPGAAGNIKTMATVAVNGKIYLYNSDEEYHPGIHRWTISGLDSIRELSGVAQLGGTTVLSVNVP